MTVTLIDTNLIVYGYLADATDPRILRSKNLLLELAREKRGVLAVQNVAEFSRICLQKYRTPVAEVKVHVAELTSMYRIVCPSSRSVALALIGVEKHQLSFWDAMLWAVSKENGVGEILTEDFQDGQIVDGVAYRNPLKTA